MATIVVGLDGSEGAKHALAFALEEARLRGASLRAIAAWQIPTAMYAGIGVPYVPDWEEFETLARDALNASLDDDAVRASGVEIERVVKRGQPAEVLIEEASGADLLVVGSRGLGGFHGLLVGSVSQQCAQHASCPVVIVPKST